MWHSNGTRHLLAAQRKALLLISRAYRNASTAALQILTGLPPLDLQLETEYEFARVTRLGVSIPSYFAPLFSSKCSKYRLSSLLDPITVCRIQDFMDKTHIHTDGSKTKSSTASAFCVFRKQHIYSWQMKLDPGNSVFQAELYATLRAVF